MLNNAPPRPTGSNREAYFMQWVYDTLHSLQQIKVPGSLVSRTTRGISSIPMAQASGGPVESDYKICRVKVEHPDYVECVEYDFESEMASINVAKPFNAHTSIVQDVITEDGETVTFDYTYDPLVANQRTLSRTEINFQGTEGQVIRPAYVVNSVILAAKVAHTNVDVSGTELEYIDTTPRLWVRVRNDIWAP